MESLTIHVMYVFKNTVGDMTFNQLEYEPVTELYLDAIRDAIRRKNHLDDSVPVIIVAWQRCEK